MSGLYLLAALGLALVRYLGETSPLHSDTDTEE